MGLERYVVDAVLIEKRSPTDVARAHGISRSWLYRLIARVRSGGYEALAPQSRRPRSSPRAVGEKMIATVLQLGATSLPPGTTPDRRRSGTTSPGAWLSQRPPAAPSGGSSVAMA